MSKTLILYSLFGVLKHNFQTNKLQKLRTVETSQTMSDKVTELVYYQKWLRTILS